MKSFPFSSFGARFAFLCSWFVILFFVFTAKSLGDESFSQNQDEEEEVVSPSISYKFPPLLAFLWGDGVDSPAEDSIWKGRVGIGLDQWGGISGFSVKELTNSAKFYGAPDKSLKLESTVLSREEAANFSHTANGTRMRGLLVIPEDGEYFFALASDDGAELWLGEPGGSRFTKERVLSCPSWTNPEDWSKYRTGGRSYSAGSVVWFEVLNKNNNGAQHVSVGWRRPGSSVYEAIPAVLEDGSVVLTVAPVDSEDVRDIGVPQSWLDSVGLGTADPVTDSRVRLYDDPDGDGFNLLEEFRTGGRPDEVGGNRGYWGLERWNNIPLGIPDMKSLLASERLSQAPDESSLQEGGWDVKPSGNYHALRLRAIVVPPRSGEWTFYVAADDRAGLFLSDNRQRFNKQMIAKLDSSSNRYQWSKYASQTSAPVMLQAGESYFMEVLQHQYNGGNHVAVAWSFSPSNLCRMPGVTATQSSQYGSHVASWAIDGNMSTFNHTNSTGSPSWLEIDLGSVYSVNQVVLHNRTDNTNGRRTSNFRISVLDAEDNEIIGEDFFTEPGTWAGASLTWDMPETVSARKIRIRQLGLNGHNNYYLHLKEVEAYEQADYTAGPTIIDSQYLYSIPAEPNDVDGNSLPDDWQEAVGLVPGVNGLTERDCAEYSDPDGDLANNRLEYLNGNNPVLPSGTPGYLTRDLWWNVAGWSVDDSMQSHAVLGASSKSELIASADMPRNIGNNYHQRVRGTVRPPVSGEYTFWISSDETSVLYLSPNERKFYKQEIARVGYGASDRGVYLTAYNQWTLYPRQRSNPIYLEAGREYYLEAHHKQYHSVNHLQIAWQIDGGSREIIPAEYLVSFAGDLTDRDDDDLPDNWETQYGISATDNGYTDFDNGAWGDPWNTGITNREAFLRGWNPQSPDLPDPGTVVTEIPVNSGVTETGSWATVGNAVMTPMGRGTIVYNNVTLPDSGRYLLEVSARPSGNVLEVETISLSASVDGTSLGSRTLRSLNGSEGKAYFLLPQLPSTSCSISLSLNNTDLRRTFLITGIRIIRPEQITEDEEGNTTGQDSWLQSYLTSANAITSCTTESLTSPLCVEGKTRVLHQAQVTASGIADPIALKPLGPNTWYADIDLPADGSSRAITARFENGAFSSASHSRWKACDLLLQGNLTLRKGDSIRACIGGEENNTQACPVTYTLSNSEGSQTFSSTTNVPLPVKFSTPGVHTLSASWLPGEDMPAVETSLTVTVVDVQMGSMMDLITGLARVVTMENVPDQVTLTAEQPLKSHPYYGDIPAGARKLNVYSEQGGALYLSARLGGSTGPVIGTKPFFSHNNTGSSTLSRIEVVQEFGDGSSLICFYLASESLPEGGYVKISLTAGGVQFLEGGKEKTFRTEDFGEEGLLRIFMTCPKGSGTSVCHTIRYYTADGKQL